MWTRKALDAFEIYFDLVFILSFSSCGWPAQSPVVNKHQITSYLLIVEHWVRVYSFFFWGGFNETKNVFHIFYSHTQPYSGQVQIGGEQDERFDLSPCQGTGHSSSVHISGGAASQAKQAIIALELQWLKVMLTKTCWSNNINTEINRQLGDFSNKSGQRGPEWNLWWHQVVVSVKVSHYASAVPVWCTSHSSISVFRLRLYDYIFSSYF